MNDLLKQKLQEYQQQHILEQCESLNEQELKEKLVGELSQLDFEFLCKILDSSIKNENGQADLEALQRVVTVNDLQNRKMEDQERWYQLGLTTISQGKVGVLLLAGGQGTRLGSSSPKGCYNIGLPSGKSLFQLQAERLLKVQRLASEGMSAIKPLMWYIMTSPFTHKETQEHFERHNYFGLSKEQVYFFQQGFLPCFTVDGKFIMSNEYELAKAPDGNGGVYRALKVWGALDHMLEKGIECLDCYCVDNVLAKLADPLFVGFCREQQAECGARVVSKAYPEEKVGVFAKRGSGFHVVEYSELDPSDALAMDPKTNRLKYNWGNICMHYFSTSWLLKVVGDLEKMSQYHVAHKKIPSKDGDVAGIKLEMFIFDTFPLATKFALLEVDRNEEFAPVKNAPGSKKDSPDTAQQQLLQLHKKWIEKAGGQVQNGEGIEISPLVSYFGEGLEQVCQGKVFKDRYEQVLQN